MSLGVSKGGFYWHFADRQALLEEMLDTWEKTGTEDIMARVQSQPGDARAKLQKLFEVTSWPEGLAVELAVRDWSRRDSDVAGRLRRADNRRLEFVRSLFRQFCADEDDVEVRSMLAYSAVIGSYFIAAEHGEKDPVPGPATRAQPTAPVRTGDEDVVRLHVRGAGAGRLQVADVRGIMLRRGQQFGPAGWQVLVNEEPHAGSRRR